jgi:hypothetical protein
MLEIKKRERVSRRNTTVKKDFKRRLGGVAVDLVFRLAHRSSMAGPKNSRSTWNPSQCKAVSSSMAWSSSDCIIRDHGLLSGVPRQPVPLRYLCLYRIPDENTKKWGFSRYFWDQPLGAQRELITGPTRGNCLLEATFFLEPSSMNPMALCSECTR